MEKLPKRQRISSKNKNERLERAIHETVHLIKIIYNFYTKIYFIIVKPLCYPFTVLFYGPSITNEMLG